MIASMCVCVHYVKEGSICEHEVEVHLAGLLQGQCAVHQQGARSPAKSPALVTDSH